MMNSRSTILESSWIEHRRLQRTLGS